MRNRKTVVVAFLLVAVMLLGTGYAAVTNVLDIQGSVAVKADHITEEFNEDIYFVGVVNNGELVQSVTAENALGYTANINTNNKDKAQFTITGITATNDSEVVTFRIKNESAHDATVSLKTITNTNGSTVNAEGAKSGTGDFGFDFYFDSQTTRTATIAAGGTVDVTVKVSLDQQLTDASTASFIIELNVTAG